MTAIKIDGDLVCVECKKTMQTVEEFINHFNDGHTVLLARTEVKNVPNRRNLKEGTSKDNKDVS
jgi:hypothetical protein